MANPLIFISAGDPSGDIATSRLYGALRDRVSGLESFGLGGARLSALGQQQLASGKDLAVLGFWEVAQRFLFFQLLMKQCVMEITKRRPKIILLVDYPGFNLRLAARVKHLGIPIVYYIAPQVWAWGHKRVHEIRKLVDQLLVILPFERAFFAEHGVSAEFVGHYLLEEIPIPMQSSNFPASSQLALLPGSRPQEIERMILPMLSAAKSFNEQYRTRAVVAGIRGAFDYDSACGKFRNDRITVEYDDSRGVIHNSELVVTASGTATLETGIIARPMVIIYRTGGITYQIARRIVKLNRIGLVNLVLGEKVVPELIQHDASPSNIVSALTKYRDDSAYKSTVHERLLTVPSHLGGAGASVRAAELVGKFL